MRILHHVLEYGFRTILYVSYAWLTLPRIGEGKGDCSCSRNIQKEFLWEISPTSQVFATDCEIFRGKQFRKSPQESFARFRQWNWMISVVASVLLPLHSKGLFGFLWTRAKLKSRNSQNDQIDGSISLVLNRISQPNVRKFSRLVKDTVF